MTFTIGNRKLGAGHPVFVIAEIGVNHEGRLDDCLEMVRQAAWAGADAIKLQTVDPDENYVKGHPSWELFRTCQLTPEETKQAFDLARELGMEPFTTSPDPNTLSWVDALGVPVHKISSGMMTNDVILRKTCALGKPVLISTGMATIEQIDHAIGVAKATGNRDIALFQCTSEYPAPLETLNLATMAWFADRYDIPVGFSDHSEGVDAAIVATGLGAVMIEKHFTLDRTRASFDHGISLEPQGFREMVDGIRAAQEGGMAYVRERVPAYEVMIGNAGRILPAKLKERAAGNLRCLVARRPIAAGEIYTEENIGLKRPFPDNRGMEPEYYESVIGLKSTRSLDVDDPIKAADVAWKESEACHGAA